jgi:hypothetical protein
MTSDFHYEVSDHNPYPMGTNNSSMFLEGALNGRANRQPPTLPSEGGNRAYYQGWHWGKSKAAVEGDRP